MDVVHVKPNIRGEDDGLDAILFCEWESLGEEKEWYNGEDGDDILYLACNM